MILTALWCIGGFTFAVAVAALIWLAIGFVYVWRKKYGERKMVNTIRAQRTIKPQEMPTHEFR